MSQENQANPDEQIALRPLTRNERRNLWLEAYGEQDIALQSWVRLAEQNQLEIPIMLQMQGLLVFGTLTSSLSYARYYVQMNEDLYRESDPETADFLKDYYASLVTEADMPEVGPEGLPILFRQLHLREVTIFSGPHKTRLPYWRGQIRAIDAFVVGASAGE